MKNLILRNLGGGISIIVDIEVVPSVFLLNDTRHRFYGDVYMFPIKCIFVSQNCTGTGNRTLLYWIGDGEAEHQGLRPDCTGL